MEAVEVRSCLDVNGDGKIDTATECLRPESAWRFITIKPALLNNARNQHYIETLLSAPCLEYPEPETAP